MVPPPTPYTSIASIASEEGGQAHCLLCHPAMPATLATLTTSQYICIFLEIVAASPAGHQYTSGGWAYSSSLINTVQTIIIKTIYVILGLVDEFQR